MQPEQPTPNYDFIMNPSAAPKRPGLGGGSLATRLLVVAVGLFVLVIIIGVAMKLLGGGSGLDKAAMLSVAQDQSEIIRLSTQGANDSASQTNKNFSVTAQLAMRSEQEKLLSYLAKNGFKPSPKDLALKQSAKTDEQLSSAKSSSTFDAVYKSVMEQALQTYQRDLTNAYTDAGTNAKKVLSANYDSSKLLLTQLTGETADN